MRAMQETTTARAKDTDFFVEWERVAPDYLQERRGCRLTRRPLFCATKEIGGNETNVQVWQPQQTYRDYLTALKT